MADLQGALCVSAQYPHIIASWAGQKEKRPSEHHKQPKDKDSNLITPENGQLSRSGGGLKVNWPRPRLEIRLRYVGSPFRPARFGRSSSCGHRALQTLRQPPRQRGHAQIPTGGADAARVLNNFSMKSPPYHVTQDDVSTPLQRLEVEQITGHQSVRGRGGFIAVLYKTLRTGLSKPSWERVMDLHLSRPQSSVIGPEPRTSTAKPTASTTE